MKKQNRLFVFLILTLLSFQHSRMGFVGADDSTSEPAGGNSNKNDIRKCYKDVRATCNCGLVRRGSRCVQNVIRQICRPDIDDRPEFKRRIRKRYRRWCRKQFKRVKKVGIGKKGGY